MGAEFFGQIGQSLENISQDAFRQQQIINERQENLDALEIANNFQVDLGEQELEARNNYNFDGKYTENALQRFEQLKQQTLSNVKNDRTKKKVLESLEKYKGDFQLSNLAFQNGAQQLKQEEQFDDALSMEMGAISLNATLSQVALSQEKLSSTVVGLSPEKKIAAEQKIKDETFVMYFDTNVNNAVEGYSRGTVTREGLTQSFDNILAEVASKEIDLSSNQRQSLIKAYQKKKIATLKNLKAVNIQAAKNRWNASLALQKENKRDLTEDDLNNYLQFLDNDVDREAARLDFQVAQEQGNLLDDVQMGDSASAKARVENFKQLSDQAIANNDPVKANQYMVAANILKGTLAKKMQEASDSVIDAFPNDTDLERRYDNDKQAFVTDAVTKASGLGIAPGNTNFLKKQDKVALKQVLTSGDFDAIKLTLRDLDEQWNFQHESLPDGLTPFDSIMGDILADKSVPDTIKGFAMYGTQEQYGNLIMNLSTTDVPKDSTKAFNKSASEIMSKTLSKLDKYSKALANSGDFQGANSFITQNANFIADLVFKSAYNPAVQKALKINSADTAVNKIMDITIRENYNISKDAQGNSIVLHKNFANKDYLDTLKSPQFFDAYVKNSVVPMLRLTEISEAAAPEVSSFIENATDALSKRLTTKTDAEYAKQNKVKLEDMTPEQRKRTVYKDIYTKVLTQQILESGSFRPIHNTSRARLYVDFGGQSLPLHVPGPDGEDMYFEIGSSEQELQFAKAKAGGYKEASRTPSFGGF